MQRSPANLRAPTNDDRGKGKTASGKRPSAKHNFKIEEWGLEIVKKHYLDPEGIRIRDQRLVPRVGADLFCEDGVFRELKTFGRAATDEINFTASEYERARTSSEKYELVIVEHVLGSPVIRVVPNPLKNLSYRPVGEIRFVGWKALQSEFRTIRLEAQTHEP